MNGEGFIGAFMYAASPKSYDAKRIIFTSERIILLDLNWRKHNILIDMLNAVIFILSFPFNGPNVNTDLLSMKIWTDMKDKAKTSPPVNYQEEFFREILNASMLELIFHEVKILRYPQVESIGLYEEPSTNDCKIKFNERLGSSSFLIPGLFVQDFRGLITKTPLASRLGGEAPSQD